MEERSPPQLSEYDSHASEDESQDVANMADVEMKRDEGEYDIDRQTDSQADR